MAATCPRCGARGIAYRDKMRWGAGKIICCNRCGAGFDLALAPWQAILLLVLGLAGGAAVTIGVAIAFDRLTPSLPGNLAAILGLAAGSAAVYVATCAGLAMRRLRPHDDAEPGTT